jgi:hypothetical protein
MYHSFALLIVNDRESHLSQKRSVLLATIYLASFVTPMSP